MALGRWRTQWSYAINDEFLHPKEIYVDIGKQVTSPTALLPSPDSEDSTAETYLYRKCCLESFTTWWRTATANASASGGGGAGTGVVGKDTLLHTPYMWATLRDVGGQTIEASPRSQAFKSGYVYSQFYNVIKAPFDAGKLYPFTNDGLENLALDPDYIKGLHKAGGATAFSQEASLKSYIHSKVRASANIASSVRKSYGTREEHRLSLTLVDEISSVLQLWEDAPAPAAAPAPAHQPHYIIPSVDVLQFLHAQLNKHCLLFEHVLAWTNKSHSLPESVVMALALRALRHTYGSSGQLSLEPILYKDKWKSMRGGEAVTLEGLGIERSIEAYGFGWFQPKINWQTLRVSPQHINGILAGNLLLHPQYQRRWRTVHDLRDVYVRLNQAEQWFMQYEVGGGTGGGTVSSARCGVQWDNDVSSSDEEGKRTLNGSRRKCRAWIDFLHGLNLNQFDYDVASMMKKNHRTSPELLGDDSMARLTQLSFCYEGLAQLFSINGEAQPPHSIVGNKTRMKTAGALVDYLLDFDDGEARPSWADLSYRLIYQKTCEVVERHLGERWRRRWETEYKFLLRLTHWVLPHAERQSFLNPTKSNHSKGTMSRMSWFSSVYMEHVSQKSTVAGWPPKTARTLQEILWQGYNTTVLNTKSAPAPAPVPVPPIPSWDISQLFLALRGQGVYASNMDEDFVLGRAHRGKTITPVWEHGMPPKLWICEQITDKSHEELEKVFEGMLSR